MGRLRLQALVVQQVGERDHPVEPVGAALPTGGIAADPGAARDIGPELVEVAGEAVRLDPELVAQPPGGPDLAEAKGNEPPGGERGRSYRSGSWLRRPLTGFVIGMVRVRSRQRGALITPRSQAASYRVSDPFAFRRLLALPASRIRSRAEQALPRQSRCPNQRDEIYRITSRPSAVIGHPVTRRRGDACKASPQNRGSFLFPCVRRVTTTNTVSGRSRS